MKLKNARRGNRTKSIAAWLAVASMIVSVFSQMAYAHGGEDHGDTQPKVTTSEKGSVSRSSRIGKIEIMVKHPVLEPDVATAGNLFITDYQTNSAYGKADVAVEVESASGTTTTVSAVKAEQAGVFGLKIPALPEGSYTMRVKVTYDGATDTVTFSGVSVEHPTSGDRETGMSWLRTALLALTGSLVLILFAGLFFVLWRSSDTQEIQGETVSA